MDIILECVQKKTDPAEKEEEKYSAQDESPPLPPPPHKTTDYGSSCLPSGHSIHKWFLFHKTEKERKKG